MQVSDIMMKMIDYSDGNLHDIQHFLKVYGYTRTIGLQEGLDDHTQEILEIGAILHDIACPLCREKYGNTNGKHQEEEGKILAREFLEKCEVPEDVIDRVVYLVGHHHTLQNIQGLDYQILIEADYLVNADESSFSRENIRSTLEKVFKTRTGIALLKSIYKI